MQLDNANIVKFGGRKSRQAVGLGPLISLKQIKALEETVGKAQECMPDVQYLIFVLCASLIAKSCLSYFDKTVGANESAEN